MNLQKMQNKSGEMGIASKKVSWNGIFKRLCKRNF